MHATHTNDEAYSNTDTNQTVIALLNCVKNTIDKDTMKKNQTINTNTNPNHHKTNTHIMATYANHNDDN